MNSWFPKWKISAALDAGHEVSDSLRRSMNSSQELQRFEADMAGLDRALKQASRNLGSPPGLHRSIMRAVGAAERQTEAPHGLSVLCWVGTSVVTLLTLLVALHALRGPVRPPTGDTQSLAGATTALEMSGVLAQRVPSAVVAPLSDELERVNRDLDNTAQFVLASLP